MAVAVKDAELQAALGGQTEVVELVKPTGETLGLFITAAEYQRLTALAECPVRSPEEAARESARVWAEVEAGHTFTTAEAKAYVLRRVAEGQK